MLGWRLIVSVFLIPALTAVFWLDARSGMQAPILFVFCLLASARCAYELHGLLTVRHLTPSLPMITFCSLLTIVAGWAHTMTEPSAGPQPVLASLGWLAFALVFIFLLLLVREAVVFGEPGRSVESLGCHLLIVLYAGGLLSVTAQFRWFPDSELGYFAIVSMIVCVKAGDIGAYTAGRLWGKRRMAPRLSPGKTWMGFNGALAGSMLGGWLWLTFAGRLFEAEPTAAGLPTVLGYSICMGLVGLTGDLCESLIKRDTGKKDAAALMPGFGGLLDLLDSPLFAGPVALAWWHLLPPAVASAG